MRYLAFCCVLLLVGCATLAPAPIEERSGNGQVLRPAVDPPPIIDTEARAEPTKLYDEPDASKSAAVQVSPAVQSLLNDAMRLTIEKEYSAAAAVLERAIQIAPNNPLVWHRLAQTRFLAGDNARAKQLAIRANALPGVTPDLRTANLALIARIESGRGNGEP